MLSLEQKIFDFFKITILFYYSGNIYRYCHFYFTMLQICTRKTKYSIKTLFTSLQLKKYA